MYRLVVDVVVVDVDVAVVDVIVDVAVVSKISYKSKLHHTPK